MEICLFLSGWESCSFILNIKGEMLKLEVNWGHRKRWKCRHEKRIIVILKFKDLNNGK